MRLRQLRIAVRFERIASHSSGLSDPARRAASFGACGHADRFLTSSNILTDIAGLEAGGRVPLGAQTDARRCKERLAYAHFASFGEFGVSTNAPGANSKTTKQSGSAPSDRIVSFGAGGRSCRPGVRAR